MQVCSGSSWRTSRTGVVRNVMPDDVTGYLTVNARGTHNRRFRSWRARCRPVRHGHPGGRGRRFGYYDPGKEEARGYTLREADTPPHPTTASASAGTITSRNVSNLISRDSQYKLACHFGNRNLVYFRRRFARPSATTFRRGSSPRSKHLRGEGCDGICWGGRIVRPVLDLWPRKARLAGAGRGRDGMG